MSDNYKEALLAALRDLEALLAETRKLEAIATPMVFKPAADLKGRGAARRKSNSKFNQDNVRAYRVTKGTFRTEN